MTGYYDYVLGAIPLALFGISGGLTAFGLSLTTAVPLAAMVAMLLVGHAMFVNAPVHRTSSDATPGVGPLNAD